MNNKYNEVEFYSEIKPIKGKYYRIKYDGVSYTMTDQLMVNYDMKNMFYLEYKDNRWWLISILYHIERTKEKIFFKSLLIKQSSKLWKTLYGN